MSEFVTGEWFIHEGETYDIYRIGFEVVSVDHWFSYGCTFSATLPVVEQICAWQERMREENHAAHWDVLRLVSDKRLVHSWDHDLDANERQIYEADENGIFHDLGFGWCWHTIEHESCNELVFSDGLPQGVNLTRIPLEVLVRELARRGVHVQKSTVR